MFAKKKICIIIIIHTYQTSDLLCVVRYNIYRRTRTYLFPFQLFTLIIMTVHTKYSVSITRNDESIQCETLQNSATYEMLKWIKIALTISWPCKLNCKNCTK